MSKLKSYQEQIQESIEKGIKVVEEQHKALIAKPFDLAEKVEAEAKTLSIKSLRDAHDQAVDSLYESLRTFNKKVNEYVSEMLTKFEGAADEVAESKPVKAASKKAAAVKAKLEEKKEELESA